MCFQLSRMYLAYVTGRLVTSFHNIVTDFLVHAIEHCTSQVSFCDKQMSSLSRPIGRKLGREGGGVSVTHTLQVHIYRHIVTFYTEVNTLVFTIHRAQKGHSSGLCAIGLPGLCLM
jgi:hypothetical protein